MIGCTASTLKSNVQYFMSCILRISGTNFDVDKFIAESEWKDLAMKVYHKGAYVNKLRKRVYEDNGFQIEISNAGFKDFERQQLDAIQFLITYRNSLLLLKNYEIDTWHCIDFGLATWPSNHFSKTYVLNAELMKLCGEYNIDVWMSNYFSAHEKRRENRQSRKFNFRKKK